MNTQSKLKDYFCPFCKSRLFRGHVNEFKMVCQECNRLVDSSQLPKDDVEQNGAGDQGDFPELAE